MKGWVLGRRMLFCLLFATTPAQAVIQATLENPGTEASGVDLVSGFAFTPDAKPVTVRPRIDSVTQDIVIPCCTPRQDVVDAIGSGTPLNSGFGALINYGNLSPGLHVIGIEVSAPDESPVIIDREVFITKPGGRGGENPALFSFLNDLDPTNARLVLDGDEIIVTPVTVTDSGGGGTRQATLRLLWARSSQRFGILSAAADTSFAAVQAIFASKGCTQVACHGASPQVGLSLTPGNAFNSLVPIRSMEDPTRFRVNPGNVEASYLYQKVIPGGNIQGLRMPLGCSGNTCLSQDEIDTIANWISAGAAPPQ